MFLPVSTCFPPGLYKRFLPVSPACSFRSPLVAPPRYLMIVPSALHWLPSGLCMLFLPVFTGCSTSVFHDCSFRSSLASFRSLHAISSGLQWSSSLSILANNSGPCQLLLPFSADYFFLSFSCYFYFSLNCFFSGLCGLFPPTGLDFLFLPDSATWNPEL
jgi:hypothetical protein